VLGYILYILYLYIVLLKHNRDYHLKIRITGKIINRMVVWGSAVGLGTGYGSRRSGNRIPMGARFSAAGQTGVYVPPNRFSNFYNSFIVNIKLPNNLSILDMSWPPGDSEKKLSGNTVIIYLIYHQNAHIQRNTCIIINILLHVSTLIAPSSWRTLSYAQNY
jgi:hypothetical protein